MRRLQRLGVEERPWPGRDGLSSLFFNGKEFFGTITLDQAMLIGVIVGALCGGAWFWLTAVVLTIGLWFRPTEGWAKGSAFATPVILAAIGFGYASYSAYQTQAQRPQVPTGTLNLELTGQALGQLEAVGAVPCQLTAAGGLEMNGDVTGTDGRHANIQFSLNTNLEVGGLVIQVGAQQAFPGKGWEIGPSTVQVYEGSTRTGGELTLSDLVPLGSGGEPDATERWSGRLTWGCGAP